MFNPTLISIAHSMLTSHTRHFTSQRTLAKTFSCVDNDKPDPGHSLLG